MIAIIGILASVVLASLNTARTKGRDASAVSSMSALRAQAELGVDNSGMYLADLCDTAGTTAGGLLTLLNAADAQNGTTAPVCTENETTAATRASAWGAVITLNDGTFYCTDSTGYAGSVASMAVIAAADADAADVACN